MSLPSHLRAHKDLTRDESTREFFNIPKGDDAGGQKGMEINAVLSVEGEAVFVSLVSADLGLELACRLGVGPRSRRRQVLNSVRPAAGRGSPARSLDLSPRSSTSWRRATGACVGQHERRLTISPGNPFPWQAGRLYLLPPYLCFISLDRRSARFTVPLFCIRRVERLNSRAGIFALGIGLWHGLRLVSASGRRRRACARTQTLTKPDLSGSRDLRFCNLQVCCRRPSTSVSCFVMRSGRRCVEPLSIGWGAER